MDKVQMDKVQTAAQSMIDNLPEKTGKSLSQWHTVIKKAGFNTGSKHGEIMRLLKTECGVSHGFANLVTSKFRQPQAESDTKLVSQQYQGKESLLGIYQKLEKAISKFGNDVEFAPKKAYVSVRRSKQFAIIQPSTKTRVDVGINLKGVKPNERLAASGSFNAMVSHRVKIAELKDVDAELINWLKQAYAEA